VEAYRFVPLAARLAESAEVPVVLVPVVVPALIPVVVPPAIAVESVVVVVVDIALVESVPALLVLLQAVIAPAAAKATARNCAVFHLVIPVHPP
jgi:hypothetical protein